MGEQEKRLQEFLDKIRRDLDRTIEFWSKYSLDKEHGGYFICLANDGHVYDETKYTWLESRQVWMYARLYNELERFKTPEILATAEHGAQFLLMHMKRKDTGKCYLSLNREGLPVKEQRTIYSECFYLMAMSELHRATGNQHYREEAIDMMRQILHWVLVDDSGLGRNKLAGNMPANTLAVPMMLLCLIEQLTTMDPDLASSYADTEQWCLSQVAKHVQRDGSVILENVSPDGKELPGCQGRLTVPGHAIEAGWFLLQRAQKLKDPTLKSLAIDKFILTSFNRGWDTKYGGLFYFLDVDGESPLQLEWDMKLWWPHNEAMIALLMAYIERRDADLLEKFSTVFNYCYSHVNNHQFKPLLATKTSVITIFSVWPFDNGKCQKSLTLLQFVDEKNGEWYGYLNRQGDVSHSFKGGPWKGCFHVPRCLMLCEQMLCSLINENHSTTIQ